FARSSGSSSLTSNRGSATRMGRCGRSRVTSHAAKCIIRPHVRKAPSRQGGGIHSARHPAGGPKDRDDLGPPSVSERSGSPTTSYPAEAPRIVTEVPGPRSRALVAEESAHLAPGIQSISILSGLAIARAEGRILEDVDGNRFLDLAAG